MNYIVMVSHSCGGAEKRFFDIFTSLRRDGEDVVLIAPASLVGQLKNEHPDRQDVMTNLLSVEIGVWSRAGFVHEYRKLLKTLPHGSSFHYPLNCLWLLHLGRGDRVTMSVVDCTSTPGLFSFKQSSVWAWISFPFVDRIDVLSPTVLAALQRSIMAKRMSLTPGGTYLVPPAKRQVRRMPTVVFLGRLVPGKGIDDLLDVIPEIWTLLRQEVPQDVRFEIAGYGILETHVITRIKTIAAMGVPISFVGYAVADSLLAQSTVLLSMQEITNYPSRVVAEALLAGCGVIVRDTGDSREFGDNLPGLLYCSAELNPQEMAKQLMQLLDCVMRVAVHSDRIRDAALERFSSTRYIDYFRDVIAP